MDFQALGCGAPDWPTALSKIQTERKDLAKKGKLLTEEVATAAGEQIAKNFSEGSSVHYHRQASRSCPHLLNHTVLNWEWTARERWYTVTRTVLHSPITSK